MMAEAVGKAPGRPGICFVTGGPDATSASAGIHTAQQDSTPMIMFVGQVTRDIKNRGALQELGEFRTACHPLLAKLDHLIGRAHAHELAHAERLKAVDVMRGFVAEAVGGDIRSPEWGRARPPADGAGKRRPGFDTRSVGVVAATQSFAPPIAALTSFSPPCRQHTAPSRCGKLCK
jgi:acetolactate synthase-1/2/3 large subunit